MKVLHINTFGNGSTGRIAADICRTLHENGHEGLVAFSRNRIDNDVPHYQFGSKWSVYMDGGLTRVTDRAGFYSSGPTKNLIKKIKEYDPDIIHLHNLHGYYINIELLFNYLKESGKPVVWTLHDCWPFTGHCPYFDFVGCDKWKTGCHNCPQIHEYPKSLVVDNSAQNYQKKKKLFTSVKRMTIVTPSNWLSNLVRQSFFNKYPVHVIHNGINQDIFKPTYGNWTRDHHLEDKKIILGVANNWEKRKGLNDLIKLSELLPEDYQVVVVGLTDKQLKDIPSNIIGIKRTESAEELAEIYTSAYVFVNPTYEDNFPSVNLEALACGTPLISYETGGGPEIITEEIGAVIPKADIQSLARHILSIRSSHEACEVTASQFDRKHCYQPYIKLYEMT